jgi:hypothetical protein
MNSVMYGGKSETSYPQTMKDLSLYHILFSRLWNNGHLGCFHFLVIMNSSASAGVPMPSGDPHILFLNKYSEVVLMDHMLVLF